MSELLLNVKNLSVNVEEIHSSGINLTINKGRRDPRYSWDRTAAGKSTSAAPLMGNPDELSCDRRGEIFFGGENITKEPLTSVQSSACSSPSRIRLKFRESPSQLHPQRSPREPERMSASGISIKNSRSDGGSPDMDPSYGSPV